MKHGMSIVLSITLFMLSAVSVFGQDPVMMLGEKEIAAHQRPPVQFQHEKHSANIDCLQCHHDYDKYLNNKGGEGQPCSACHGLKSKPEILPLTEAFHIQCKSCHDAMRQEGSPSGPVMCGECHVKK